MSQGASGASYVINYQANITLTEETTIEVNIVSVYPQPRNIKPDPREVQIAQHAIQEGCAQVLEPINYGAQVAVTDLVIHPIDFKPRQYARWTAIDLQQQLDKLSGKSA